MHRHRVGNWGRMACGPARPTSGLGLPQARFFYDFLLLGRSGSLYGSSMGSVPRQKGCFTRGVEQHLSSGDRGARARRSEQQQAARVPRVR